MRNTLHINIKYPNIKANYYDYCEETKTVTNIHVRFN